MADELVDADSGPDSGSASLPVCPKLEALFVARNRIADWKSLHALDSLPSLCEVRLTGNPLTEGVTPSIARLEIIGRMGRLTALNGSSVRSAERRDAEIRYVQLMLAELDEELKRQPGSDPDAAGDAARRVLADRHPRYVQLYEKYGSSVTRAGSGAGGSGTGVGGPSIVEVQIKCIAPSAGERPPTFRRLPVSMTVAKVCMLCEKLYGVPAIKQALSLVLASAEDDFPVPLENGRDDLAFLGVQDGSTIFVNEADEKPAGGDVDTTLDERIRIGEEEMRMAAAGRVQLAPAREK